MALLLRWLVPLVLMLLQNLGKLLHRKRRVAWSACGRISSGPFRSGSAIDSTTCSFILYTDHVLRGRLLTNFMLPLLGLAVTSFCKVTRPFYLLIRSAGNAKLFREFGVKCRRPLLLNFRRYRGFDRSAIATGAAAALVRLFLCGTQAASSKHEAPGMTTRHAL